MVDGRYPNIADHGLIGDLQTTALGAAINLDYQLDHGAGIVDVLVGR